MAKQRIAILVPNFAEADGGARVAKTQAEELAAEGKYVAVFAFAADMRPIGADLLIMGMPKNLFWQRIYRLIFPLDIFKTIKWIPKLRNFDEVIVHLYPLTWLGFLAKTFYRVKYTFWYHGIMDPLFFPYLRERIYIRLQILLTKLTVRNVDKAVAVSKYIQKELKKYTGLDSEVSYNKVDHRKFRQGIDDTEVRRQYNLERSPVILFVGALRPVKGVHLLIQAFNLLKEDVQNARLIIVGRPDYPYYFEKLKRMSDDSVIFVDFVSNDFLPFYYAACDIYATCSMWESYNIPLVEAQLCGKPVVAFDIGPHREVINSKGVLVEQANVEEFSEACKKKLNKVRKLRDSSLDVRWL